MARVTYEFDPELDAAKLRAFQNAENSESTIQELRQYLRGIAKHGEHPRCEFAEELIAKLHEIASYNRLTIDL